MKRRLVSILALLLAACVAPLPATSAYAAGVVVSGVTVTGNVRADPGGAPVVDIIVCASFDQPVVFIEALVESSSTIGDDIEGPDGGGRTTHWCGIAPGLGPLKPGTTVTMTVNVGAHNGNGLSEGHGSGTGSFTVPGAPPVPKKTAEQAADLGHASNALWKLGAILAVAGILIALSGGTAIPALLGILSGGVCAYLAADLSDMSLDPPDSNYQVTVVPHNPDISSLTAPYSIPASVSDSFGKLQTLWANEAGLADATVAALYKAEGAAAAHDAQWEQTQTLAAAGFAKQLATDLGTEPAMRAAVATALGAAASGPAVTEDNANTAKTTWTNGGLSPQQTALLSLGKANSPIPNDLHAIVEGTDSTDLTQTAGLQAFAQTGADNADADAAAVLTSWSTLLTANPTGAVPDSGQPSGAPSGSPSGPPSATPTPTPTPTPTLTPGPVKIPNSSILKDGGFESTPLGDNPFETLKAADQAKLGPGWVIDAGSVDLVGPGAAVSAEGTQFIDLNGNAGTGPGAIHIDLPTVSGHTYQVSFQLAANPNSSPPLKTLTASFGTTSRNFTFNVANHTNSALGWTNEQFTAAICASSGRLSLKSTMPNTTAGPNVDAVAVVDLGDQGGCGGGGFPLWLIIGIVLVVLAAVAVILILYARRSRTPDADKTVQLPAARL